MLLRKLESEHGIVVHVCMPACERMRKLARHVQRFWQLSAPAGNGRIRLCIPPWSVFFFPPFSYFSAALTCSQRDKKKESRRRRGGRGQRAKF